MLDHTYYAWNLAIRVDMYGVIHSANLKIQYIQRWQQESPYSTPTPIYTKILIIAMNLHGFFSHVTVPCKCCMHGQPSMAICKCKGLRNGNRNGEQTDGERLEVLYHKNNLQDAFIN